MAGNHQKGAGHMNEERFNMGMRKFLKKVGITSQREIEKAVNQALAAGKLTGNEALRARVTLEIPEIGLQEKIEDVIALE